METLPSFSLQASKLETSRHMEQGGASPLSQRPRAVFVGFAWGERSVFPSSAVILSITLHSCKVGCEAWLR